MMFFTCLQFTENQSFQQLEGLEMQSHNQDSGMEVWDHSPSESNINLELIDITALEDDENNQGIPQGENINLVSSTRKCQYVFT